MNLTLAQIKKKYVGTEWPVWWETNDGRPAGKHRAMVIAVREYTGRYDFMACIFLLSAPNTYKGSVEMTIPWIELEHVRNYEE
jgi:hypothetical protein